MPGHEIGPDGDEEMSPSPLLSPAAWFCLPPSADSVVLPDAIRVRKSRGFLGHVVSFDSLGNDVPVTVPPHLEETAESSVSAEVREKMIASFAKRPIWNRVSLLYETGASFNEVKYILPTVAYYFQDNPFRACWVRLGYDFRKDKESRRYQVIDFRLRKSYGNKRVDTEGKENIQVSMILLLT